jgi:LPS export ABC transporter protein LptC
VFAPLIARRTPVFFMASWQRKARLLVAFVAIAIVLAVALTFRRAPASTTTVPVVSPSDPKALLETATGQTIRVDREQEQIRISYESAITYPDAPTKLQGVKVMTKRAGGRTFLVSARQGELSQNQTNISLVGDVRLETSDGMQAAAETASYTDADSLLRSPGPVTFRRGRLRGAGTGLTYAKNTDTLTLHEAVTVDMAADDKGNGEARITAGSAEFNRVEHIIRFGGRVEVIRGGRTINADSALARLSTDEQRLEAVELRGAARMAPGEGSGTGGFRTMQGDAIDLKYRPDGETLERAVAIGSAEARVAGEKGAGDRVITARTLDAAFAPDGSTPTAVAGRDNVELTIPAERDGPARTIQAPSLDGEGEAGRGLTRARFSGGVTFRERGGDVNRSVRSGTLDAALAPGLSAIEDARFTQTVRFSDGNLAAAAASARYALADGTLELWGSEPALKMPQVENDRISVYAERIDVRLSGPMMKARGTVKSELKPVQKKAAAAEGTRVPSMFNEDQLIAATAGELVYDGAAAVATYTANAQVWQGDTSIRGEQITLNEKSGDLTANGSVLTVIPMDHETKDKGKERVQTTASAAEFQYDEASRRATYLRDARANGPQGDMTAAKIELYLKESGRELERAEAYEQVTLRDEERETKGSRMTYFALEERYVMDGAPVVIKDECGSETTGNRVTYNKRTDTIVIDNRQQTRTRTKGGANCR